MATKTELVDELARLTNEPKVTFKGKSKEKLIILLHETRKGKNYPKRGKHVWLVTPPKRRTSSRSKLSSSPRKTGKHVWLDSPRTRRRRKSPKSPRKSGKSVSPKSRRRRSQKNPRKLSLRKSRRRISSHRRYKRSKSVSWGGKHVIFGSPMRKKYIGGKVRRSSLKPKRGYRALISSDRELSPRAKIESWHEAYASKQRSRVRSPTKKYYVDELSHITGRTKKYYNSWSKPELKQRMEAIEGEYWKPKNGKHVWLSTPPKRSGRISRKRSGRISRKRSRSISRKSSRRISRKSSKKTYKTECKSYQIRVNSRCRNKPCKEGKIRDSVTKKCRSKKNRTKRS